jgi:hypothetical protein
MLDESTTLGEIFFHLIFMHYTKKHTDVGNRELSFWCEILLSGDCNWGAACIEITGTNCFMEKSAHVIVVPQTVMEDSTTKKL